VVDDATAEEWVRIMAQIRTLWDWELTEGATSPGFQSWLEMADRGSFNRGTVVDESLCAPARLAQLASTGCLMS